MIVDIALDLNDNELLNIAADELPQTVAKKVLI